MTGRKSSGVVGPLDALLEQAVERALQARVDELQRPQLVHQRTVEAVVGLPRRDFLRLARAGAFPSTHERRLVIARAADVIAAFERRMPRIECRVADETAKTGESAALARVGARRIAT